MGGRAFRNQTKDITKAEVGSPDMAYPFLRSWLPVPATAQLILGVSSPGIHKPIAKSWVGARLVLDILNASTASSDLLDVFIAGIA